jgi:ferredoxin
MKPGMAYKINERCSGCGRCVPTCPTAAIAALMPFYRIDPFVCVECLGFAGEPQCAAVCPDQAVEPAW